MKHQLFRLIVLTAVLVCSAPSLFAQASAFTYQGRLNDASGPANGTYDLRFTLHDAATAGIQQGGTVTTNAAAVSNGMFTVTLDFGANVFTNGGGRWLEIAARTNGAGAFTTLNPRQPLTAVPYAVRALNGTQGPQGAKGINWRGAWNVGTAYMIDDAVAYNGASWLATGANDGTPPSIFSSHVWALLADKGATGAAGPQGIQGMVGPAGAKGVNWRGNFAAGGSYVHGDAVAYNGASWFATAATSSFPGSFGAAWDLLAAKGDTGPQGPAGVAPANVARLDVGNSFSGNQLVTNGSGFFGNHSGALSGVGAGVRIFRDSVLGAGSIFAYDYTAGVSQNLILQQAGGNVGIGTTTPTAKLEVSGEVTCTAVNLTSDRNAKERFKPVNPREVLAKVTSLPISEWQYKAQGDARHIGPMAQDFREAFALGRDERHIATVDADGVALAAIQGLNEKLEERLRDKDARIDELEKTVAELKALVSRALAQSQGGAR